MERTRDISPKSLTGSDVRSVFNSSSNSQPSDKIIKNVQNIVEGPSAMLPLLNEAINETIAEKSARGKEITELLRLLDIDVKSMPKEIQDLWSKAVGILHAQGLDNFDEITLTLCMHRNTRETINKAREERKLKERFNRLQESQSIVLEKSNRVRDSVDVLRKVVEDESNDNERRINRMNNAVKFNDYKEVAEKTEEALVMLGANDYFPAKILDKYKNYLELQEELRKVENSLCKYSDLPPNLSEARVKLAEKEKYLKDLEHAIFEKMK